MHTQLALQAGKYRWVLRQGLKLSANAVSVCCDEYNGGSKYYGDPAVVTEAWHKNQVRKKSEKNG